MIRAIAFLPTVGECICASFPLAIVTYGTHITTTVCLAWSTHNTALPKVHGTNQHENSAHSCSSPILYVTIMASENQNAKCLYTDRKILPQKQRQRSAIATTPGSADSRQAPSSCHTLLMHAVPRAHSDEDEIELTAETQTHAWTPLFADLYVSKGRSCC